MAKYIDASELVKYNANDMDRSIGDCVKRSLSLAYRMDYREVSQELNRLRPYGSAYNSMRTFKQFVENRGDKFVPVKETITTEEFADNNPFGTYVLLVGRYKNKYSTHLVSIINGKVYDSWDSRPWYVYDYAIVTGDVPDLHEDIDVADIQKPVYDAVIQYLGKLGPLKDGQDANYDVDLLSGNNLTSYIIVRCTYQYKGRSTTSRCRLAVKVNIGLDFDKNIEVNIRKCKQKIYDWLYEINRVLRSETLSLNPKFYGDKRLLLNLPQEIIPQILSADKFWDNYNDSDIYEFRIAPFEDDPDRYTWYLTAYNMSDIKTAFKEYLKDRTRIEY